MAINKNHLFEDLDGVKCAVVESGVTENRMQFLKSLLELNGYTVVVASEVEKKVPAPAPISPPAEVSSGELTSPPITQPPIPLPATIPEPPVDPKYKIGVADVTFNSINAIYGRLLKTADKKIVTMAYWLQKEAVSNDEIPYFDKK